MAINKIWLVTKLPHDNTEGETTRRRAATNILVSLGVSSGITFERDDAIKLYYTTEADAIRSCEHLATKNPMTPYAVMAISTIRETGVPQVITKSFTNEGELVIV